MTAADFPCEQAMLLAVSLHHKARVTVNDRGLALVMDGATHQVSTLGDGLDQLEARGWVVVDAAGVRLTGTGSYWLRRWLNLPEVRAKVRALPRRTA